MPDWKRNGGVNTCQGIVMHSMVGPYSAALGELKSPTRRASWHFSIKQDGTVVQHADTAIRCWHAGSVYNNSTIGIEHEGGLNPVHEPLTPAQLAASVALVRWLSKTLGFPMVRQVALWEHHEVSVLGTQCPSGRIPWAEYTKEEDDVKPILAWVPGWGVFLVTPSAAHYIPSQAVVNELAALYGISAAPSVGMSPDAAMALGGK